MFADNQYLHIINVCGRIILADNQYLHIFNVCGWIIFADNQYLHIINVCGWIIFADDQYLQMIANMDILGFDQRLTAIAGVSGTNCRNVK